MKNNIIKYKKFKKMDTVVTSGILFIYKNKILLVHPINRKWNSSFSYPKGRVDNNESIISAAVRETEEEIGVKIPNKILLNKNLYRIVNKDIDTNSIKIDYYFIVRLDNKMFSKYFKNNIILKKKNLQKDEINWGGFISLKDSRYKIKNRLKSVLKHIK